MTVERISTGIPELDKNMEGGLVKNTSTLIVGGPGAGKSIMSMQCLVEGAMNGEPGLYVSFEENEEQAKQSYMAFDWGLQELIDDNKILFKYLRPEHVSTFTKGGTDPLRDIVQEHGVKRIVLDSITTYEMMFDDNYDRRMGILKLLEALKGYDSTIILTHERDTENDGLDFIDFLVQGVIVLYNIRSGGQRQRGAEILKMRATKHTQKVMPMNISDSGIKLYPEQEFLAESM